MNNDIDTPAPPTRAGDANGEILEDGSFVIGADDADDALCGEVQGFNGRGQVLVAWQVQDRPGGFYRDVLEWVDAHDLRVTY